MALTNEQKAYLDGIHNMVSEKEYSIIGNMLENGKGMEEVQSYANETIMLEDKIQKGTATDDEVYQHIQKTRDYRESGKDYLAYVADTCLKNENVLDNKLVGLLKDIKKYAGMDVTATTELYSDDAENTYENENKLFQTILQGLDEYEKTMERDPDKVLEVDGKKINVAATQKVVYNMLGFFENLQNGQLKDDQYEQELLKNDPNAKTKGVFIDATGKNFTSASFVDYNKDVSDLPLFSHDPSPSDLRQGFIGDCYLMAGLSELARRDPEAIKNSMRDNGKTVTVRFWQRVENREAEMDDFVPVYVTVDKKVPRVGSAQNCCWAQILERAYVASGLHMSKGFTNKYNMPRPDNLDQMYEEIKKLDPDDRPTMQECPWLIDQEGNLHKPEYNYEAIEGGESGPFLAAFMGKEYESHEIILDDYIEPAVAPVVAVSNIEKNLLERFNITFPEDGHPINDRYKLAAIEAKILHGPDAPLPPFTIGVTGEKVPVDGDSGLVPGVALSTYIGDLDSMTANDDFSVATMDSMGIKAIDSAHAIVGSMVTTQEEKENAEKIGNFLKNELAGIKATCLGKELTGRYSGKAQKLYNNIKEWTEDKKYTVTCGTFGDSDKNSKEGIYDNHAYSVLGVEEKELGGKMMKFVKVRNPHGKTGRLYKADKNNNITRHHDSNCKDGVFLVELDDFLREYRDLNYNCPTAKPTHISPDAVISPSCASKWSRVATNLYKSVKNTDSYFSDDSPEYSEMKDSLRSLDKACGNSVGYPYESLQKYVTRAFRGAQNYYNHLIRVSYPNYDTMDPKPTEPRMDKLSSRQKARLTVVESIQSMHRQYMNNHSRDPKADMKKEIIERMAEKFVSEIKDNPAAKQVKAIWENPVGKQKMLEAMGDLPSVQKMLKGKTFFQLDRIQRSPVGSYLRAIRSDLSKIALQQSQKAANPVGLSKEAPDPKINKPDDVIIRNKPKSVSFNNKGGLGV